MQKLTLLVAAVSFASCDAGPDRPVEGSLDDESGDVGITEVGEYTVYHRAVRTTALAPAALEAYGLPEGSDEILLIVAVEQRELGDNLPAEVEVRAVNLTGQLVDVDMREIHSNEMISYVGVVEVENREVLDFRIELLPEGAERAIELEFRERFFTQPPA